MEGSLQGGSPKPSLKRSRLAAFQWGALLIGVAGICYGLLVLERYRRNEPRRNAIAVVSDLERALTSSDVLKSLPLLQLPPAALAKTPEELTQWLNDVMSDEISSAGLEELRRYARFGSLVELFPDEGRRWAESVHVSPEKCIAFRLERNGLRAEIVLYETRPGLRVIRCNNVRQMASPSS
jgi:hypothetical protein